MQFYGKKKINKKKKKEGSSWRKVKHRQLYKLNNKKTMWRFYICPFFISTKCK